MYLKWTCVKRIYKQYKSNICSRKRCVSCAALSLSPWCPPPRHPSGMFDIILKFGRHLCLDIASKRHQESGADKRKKKRHRDDAHASMAGKTMFEIKTANSVTFSPCMNVYAHARVNVTVNVHKLTLACLAIRSRQTSTSQVYLYYLSAWHRS